eukprot:TRINITY_DN11784_c0_g1_i1.p1 TRINITY_DN11784_c0_g1~~TRINITY_DN11784_c0_g1_i1.p1  ORF type:complete len:142 (-),score=27.25 TRINITY_DN11784_c0_g1_i1:114-539(-)
MVIRTTEVVEALRIISEQNGLQATASQSLKGGLITGGVASFSALLLGPAGLAIGGTLGGILATYLTKDKFVPVGQIIMEMEERDKHELYRAVQNFVTSLDAADAMQLVALVQGNDILKRNVIAALTAFIRDNINYQVYNSW